jgi:hypothetical protein
MIFVCVEEHLESEEAILAAKCGGPSKLESRAMELKESKGTPIHDQGEDFATDIHQHDTGPFVWVG